jgi:chitin disaccharide deacetylase
MKVIVNADDFGGSDDTVAATVACFEEGVLTSATIMPGMPATAAAVSFARANPQFSFGVHLLVTGDGVERPLSDPADVPGLVDGDGAFLRTGEARKRALLGRLPVDQLERELAAQIESVRSEGVDVSHVDSHRHLHKLGSVRTALGRVLPRFGIRRVRRVQNVYLGRPLTSPTYWLGPLWQRRLERAGTVTTAHFYMPTGLAEAGWETRLLGRMDGLQGTLEVGVHPGTDGDWREAERAGATRFAGGARDRGHELVPWTALPCG